MSPTINQMKQQMEEDSIPDEPTPTSTGHIYAGDHYPINMDINTSRVDVTFEPPLSVSDMDAIALGASYTRKKESMAKEFEQFTDEDKLPVGDDISTNFNNELHAIFEPETPTKPSLGIVMSDYDVAIETALKLGLLPSDDNKLRKANVGSSNYAKHFIQPWSIWLDYPELTPWDHDIIKRVLRTKEGDSRQLDYEKIIHNCQERIRQLKNHN